MEFSGTSSGWRSKSVSLRAGEKIRLLARTGSARYGYIVVTDSKYNFVSKTATFYPGRPASLEYTAPASGTYRVGVTVNGDFSIDIETVSPVLSYWPEPGAMTEESFWRTRVDEAPIDPRNAEYVADLVRQAKASAGSVAYFNVYEYNMPRYLVSAAVPRVRVEFRDEQKKGYTPETLFDPKYGAHFVGVPITAEMIAAAGTDAAISIWCPETDQMWGLWRARQDSNGMWSAVWGGRIDNVSKSRGYYLNGMGIAATGTATEVGALGIEEVRAGEINHAISLTLMDCAKWNVFVWPAQRSDGNGYSPIPEGTRFRLDPTVDVDSLKLTPIGKMVARAAQKYGFIVTDKSWSSITISAESGAGIKRETGSNPWVSLMGKDKGYTVFKNLPWDKMQAIEGGWGKVRVSDTLSDDVDAFVGDSAK